MFSQTVEYALRAMVHLADKHEEGPQTTQEIADQTEVPVGYLSKVLQSLGKAELVTSQRGLHGGFRLGWEPVDISLIDVINAIEPIRRIKSCPLDLVDHQLALCPLHQRLDDAAAGVEDQFAGTSLAQLLEEIRARRKSCPFPRLKRVRPKR